MIPRAFAAGDGDTILRLDTGHEDAGEPIAFRVETAAIAPAGVEGDCAFDRVRLTITWTAPVTLTVTPILDGTPITESTHTIALASSASRVSKVFELVLRRVSARNIAYALRGTWLSLRIQGTAAAGDLIIDPAMVEFEVLSPTHTRPPLAT